MKSSSIAYPSRVPRLYATGWRVLSSAEYHPAHKICGHKYSSILARKSGLWRYRECLWLSFRRIDRLQLDYPLGEQHDQIFFFVFFSFFYFEAQRRRRLVKQLIVFYFETQKRRLVKHSYFEAQGRRLVKQLVVQYLRKQLSPAVLRTHWPYEGPDNSRSQPVILFRIQLLVPKRVVTLVLALVLGLTISLDSCSG